MTLIPNTPHAQIQIAKPNSYVFYAASTPSEFPRSHPFANAGLNPLLNPHNASGASLFLFRLAILGEANPFRDLRDN